MNITDIIKKPVVWISIISAFMFFYLPQPFNLVSLGFASVIPLTYYVINTLRRRGLLVEVDEELVFLMTHMYSVSTGKPPAEKLFTLRGISGSRYGIYGETLRKIATLAKEWGYGFIKSIQIQAQRVTNPFFKDFLIRLSEALNVGEDTETFLKVEFDATLTEYESNYDRVLEAIKTLLGIYTAAASSAIFIVVNMTLIALLLYGGLQLIIAAFVSTILALATLVFLMYRLLPKENLVHNLEINLPELKLYVYTLLLSVTAGALLGVVMFQVFKEPAYFMISFGVMLVLPGILGKRIENKVKNVDNFFTIFIRSFGLTYLSIRSYVLTLRSLLRTDFGELSKPLRKLYARLTNGVDKKVAWFYFIGESGSEAVRKGIDIFYDATEAGGDPTKVGTALSITLQKLLDLKKKREQVAKAFEATMYFLHTLIVAITEFIIALVIMFQDIFAKFGNSLPLQAFSITYVDPQIVILMKLILIFAVTLLNAFAMKVASGGFSGTIWIKVSVLLIISGITMLLSSQLVNTMIQSLGLSLGYEDIASLPQPD